MNKFDINFFSKYIPEWQELITIIHTHPINIINSLIVKLALFAVLPSVFYYYSISIQKIVPFYALEILLIVVFIKTIYDIFDWYNDVWIITDCSVIWLEWSFLKANSDSIEYDSVEWVWVEQSWLIDKILGKWDLVIHKMWEDSFVLNNAVSPYKAVDIIEWIINKEEEDEEVDKFDMIMDALSWVVWNYLEKWKKSTKNQEELEEKIKEIEKEIWTIDLR